MRITEDVRRYADEQGVKEEDAIKRGLEEKAAEFTKAGELYQKVSLRNWLSTDVINRNCLTTVNRQDSWYAHVLSNCNRYSACHIFSALLLS